MRICDLLHETCFKLWNLYKERNKKGELLLNYHRVNTWGDSSGTRKAKWSQREINLFVLLYAKWQKNVVSACFDRQYSSCV